MTIASPNMSYSEIQLVLSYSKTRHSADIDTYVGAVILDNHEKIYKICGNKINLLYFILHMCFTPHSLFKIVVFISKQLLKPVSKRTCIPYMTSTLNSHNEAPEQTQIQHKQNLGIPNIDNYCEDTGIKTKRANTLNNLRKYLYTHDLKLQGKILKRIEHRVSEDDLLKSLDDLSYMPKLSTTQITFGNDLNKILNETLPSMITLRKKKMSNETYVLFKDDDYGFLEETLKRLYLEPIKVTFD